MRLARQGALAQQLNAIESLASVDILCLDKTGTLTEPTPRVVAVVPAAGVSEEKLRHTLGRYAASSPSRNATLEAIHSTIEMPAEEPAASVPFSSGRRWSGLELAGTRYVLGAPELLADGELGAAAAAEQAQGRRVIAIGTTTAPFPEEPGAGPPPVAPVGIAVLAEGIRPNARKTVDYFLGEGVELKVISGDAPETVGSIASDVGIPQRLAPKDGRDLPEEPELLGELARLATVIGRIDPDGKRRVVESLRDQGFYVGMVGDGVNDVPALKASRLGIAQGSGTQMAKSVADVVLLSGDFAAVPRMVAQGRQILRNVQRVAKLFVTKAVFAAFLILSIGLTPEEYPLLPRHLTISAALAIGIPAFFLALAPSEGPWRTERFLREVGRFAVPAGVAAGLGVLASYLVAKNVFDLGLEEARTVATTVLILVGLYLILVLEATGGRRGAWVGLLCLALLAVYVLVLATPFLRDFFELVVPGPAAIVVTALGAFLAVAFLVLTDERFVPAPARDRIGAADDPALESAEPDAERTSVR
jgi:magnesium-transporting ATPase (P-type)